MKKNILFAIANLFIINLFSQMPNTDIWLFDIKDEAGKISFSNPRNITNRLGYDNQPSFSADGFNLYYTAMQDNNQSEIFKYDLKSKTNSSFTKTTTSEYSPMFTPDGKCISVVMVEPDSTQRLWKFPVGGEAPSLIMDNVDSVGYYCWLNKDNIVTFILTKPSSLQVFNIKSQKVLKIEMQQEIGRAIQKLYDDKFLFLIKTENGNFIKTCKMDLQNSFTIESNVIKTVGDGEDFVVYKKNILMCSKSEIYIYLFEKKNWIKLDDFSMFGIKNITRIAVSQNGKMIAIVGEN